MPQEITTDINSKMSSSDSSNEDAEKPGRKKWSLPQGVSRFSMTVITIVLTATITWYVNFKFSHLKPIISITNVEFIYDLNSDSSGKKDEVLDYTMNWIYNILPKKIKKKKIS